MEEIFTKTIVFTPADSYSVTRLPFSLSRDYSKISIRYSYGPKVLRDEKEIIRQTLKNGIEYGLYPEDKKLTLEECPDILNMICLSLDKAGQFCGMAHRHNPEQTLELSEEKSSPGFYRIKPEKGEYCLQILVNNISTKTCTYQVSVLGE